MMWRTNTNGYNGWPNNNCFLEIRYVLCCKPQPYLFYLVAFLFFFFTSALLGSASVVKCTLQKYCVQFSLRFDFLFSVSMQYSSHTDLLCGRRATMSVSHMTRDGAKKMAKKIPTRTSYVLYMRRMVTQNYVLLAHCGQWQLFSSQRTKKKSSRCSNDEQEKTPFIVPMAVRSREPEHSRRTRNNNVKLTKCNYLRYNWDACSCSLWMRCETLCLLSKLAAQSPLFIHRI